MPKINGSCLERARPPGHIEHQVSPEPIYRLGYVDPGLVGASDFHIGDEVL
ncbi:hypothetical protein [Ensifer sp. MJa1]|uniref:hypothetical protein n=1 Tax=Ensifer sp. MJa1 TaxID=2919888 RepID=UPI003009E771